MFGVRVVFRSLKVFRSNPVKLGRLSLCTSPDKLEIPPSSNESTTTFSPKITEIVDKISELNLLEVADLNQCLKQRLNISDAPVMMGGGVAAAPPPKEEEEEETAAPIAVQTSFTIKLMEFDAAKKVGLIKELKSQIEGMNLVQAKKFVESAPAVIKADIAKPEAEKLKEVLEAVGATCEIE